ncbi:response regulator [Natrinema sp. CBA1119]|uniref:response regulator n=1 Tax=Natrinema sp. CBA1119 TaxID=1608465 RepID=UPI000BF7D269|nr:response regulator [Natrinema sp. CBA1119]PGF15363.1 response regulator [Natrinema sp. CBA1119]
MDGPKEIGDVLLIEDNPGDVRLTKELLEEAGIHSTIHTVTDGGEALDVLQQQNGYEDAPRPDLILIDWHLPKMTVGEILAEAREATDLSDILIVVLTGSGARVERIEEETAAADEILTKPIDPSEFPETLESL